ncbi:MFS transporter [Arthrobacter sp. zg-Y820]|uniref:MFS transporter n=1 Tax=unclassified Arthrobacter TaxID=235627 RepID=UPI001E3800A4|nr:MULTISPECIES: MFS transporter [unclassified Arthrobacter]MCC9198218.1 MFS transporter [Arthrobacter sp. zg-Y820]MDK1281087.1 MFS transporter [Arthrobacter sp. zg.Y820]WIB10546.1 MFS transporter [Arthrobacter sp. zg-Y820]
MSLTPALQARRASLAIFALAAGGFAIGTTEFAIMGLLQEMVLDLGISVPAGGHVISAYAVGVVVGAPILAALGARIPRKTLALGLMVLFSVGNLSSFFAPDYNWLLATRFLSGLPHGAFFGVAAVIAASLVAPTRRARAISMVMLGLSIANVVGVPFATWLGQQAGWRWMFVMVSAIGVLTVALVARYVPHQATHPEASIRRELSALRRIQVWLALLVGTVGFGGFFAVYAYISPTMTNVAGFDASLLPLIVGLYGLGQVAGNIIGGRLADRSVMGSIYGILLGTAVILAAYAWLVQYKTGALALVFLVGAIGSMLVPPLQTRLLDAAPGAQSLASSLNHSALNMANALGALLGGLVIAWGWGYRSPAVVGAVLALLGLGIALLSGWLDRKSPQAPAPSAAHTHPVPSK